MDRSVVLVTGASRGLGRAAALLLAEHGYQVFGTARKPSADSAGGVQMVALDVTSQESVTSCVSHVLDRAGRIDVLVNNAGAALIGAVEETPVEDAIALFDTTLAIPWAIVTDGDPDAGGALRGERRGADLQAALQQAGTLPESGIFVGTQTFGYDLAVASDSNTATCLSVLRSLCAAPSQAAIDGWAGRIPQAKDYISRSATPAVGPVRPAPVRVQADRAGLHRVGAAIPGRTVSALTESVAELRTNPRQWEALSTEGNCVVLAPPGSGKTKLLTTRMAHDPLISIPLPHGAARLRGCPANTARR